jgi:hypothetical protein
MHLEHSVSSRVSSVFLYYLAFLFYGWGIELDIWHLEHLQTSWARFGALWGIDR